MNDNYDNEEEKSSLQSIGETVQKGRARGAQISNNLIKGKNTLEKLTKKNNHIPNPQGLAPKLPQAEEGKSKDSSLDLDDKMADMPQKAAAVVRVGVSLFSKKTWIILGAGFIFFFFLSFVLFMVLLVDDQTPKDNSPVSPTPNVDYNLLYDKVDEIVYKYKNDYGVEIDKYLIISTLTAYKDNPEYTSEGTNKWFDYVDTDDKTIKVVAMIEVLAKYQMKTVMNCNKDSSSNRKIASNDDVLGITNYWTSELIREKNYTCDINANGITYEVSNEKGNITDENSGSTFYWNMIDEEFFKEYYPNYFGNLTEETYEHAANETLEYIYSYAKSLKETKK